MLQAIYGILSNKPEQENRASLLKMQQTAAERKLICAESIFVNNMALGSASQASINDISETEKYLFAFSGRIYNREELTAKLNADNIPFEKARSSFLMYHAFLKWGQNFTEHVIGDWSLAILNKLANEITLIRDHCGSSAIYYTQQGNTFAFASTIPILLSLNESPLKIYTPRIVSLLSNNYDDANHTSFEHIKRLPAGHWLKFSKGQLEIQKYWDISNIKIQNDFRYEEFVDVFKQSVKCRLDNEKLNAVCLSGGLDSGSVATIAAEFLQQQEKQLIALTSVPLKNYFLTSGSRLMGDETELASKTAAFVPNISHRLIDSHNTNPLMGIRQSLTLHGESLFAAGNQYWLNAILQEAASCGVGVLLSGQAGNATISWPVNTVKFKNPNIGFEKLVHETLKKLRIFIAKSLQNNVKKSVIELSPLNPALLKSVPPASQKNNLQEARIKMLQMLGISGSLWFEKGLYYGFATADPTLDKRLVEYCLALPNRAYFNEKGSRLLVREGLKNYLPPEVLNNQIRGRQAADSYARLCEMRTEVMQLLVKIEKSSLVCSHLNMPKLHSIAKQIGTGFTPKHALLVETTLLKAIMTGMFLYAIEFGVHSYNEI
jgi:asparagine synthase (glutamine-hydrolysing)